MSPDWLALAADPAPVLAGLLCLAVATVAVVALAIEQHARRAADQRAEDAYEAGVAAGEALAPLGAVVADEAALAAHHAAATAEGLTVPADLPNGQRNARWS